jgi:diguanylate cyclase (GGDEF)-like protein
MQRELPRLADYVTLEELDQDFTRRNLKLSDRQYDEKFHILQGPSLLGPDIGYYREVCGARRNMIAVAYLDIDNFKVLNANHGEAVVDSNVLPVFMRELERFVFSRGHAYRFGGDEYAILLTNAQGADRCLQDLQRSLAEVPYRDIKERTPVSIGLCTVDGDSYLSDQAVVERANKAMRHAKKAGRNCIATYGGELFRDEDLVVYPRRSCDHHSSSTDVGNGG